MRASATASSRRPRLPRRGTRWPRSRRRPAGIRLLSGMSSQAAIDARRTRPRRRRAPRDRGCRGSARPVATPRLTRATGTSSSPPATRASSAQSRTGAIDAGAGSTPRAGPSQATVASSVDGENRIPMCSTPGIACACRAVPAVASPYGWPTTAVRVRGLHALERGVGESGVLERAEQQEQVRGYQRLPRRDACRARAGRASRSRARARRSSATRYWTTAPAPIE